jgi:hypothetical protein
MSCLQGALWWALLLAWIQLLAVALVENWQLALVLALAQARPGCLPSLPASCR